MTERTLLYPLPCIPPDRRLPPTRQHPIQGEYDQLVLADPQLGSDRVHPGGLVGQEVGCRPHRHLLDADHDASCPSAPTAFRLRTAGRSVPEQAPPS